MNVEQALKLITFKLQQWLEQLIRILPNLLLAAFIIVAGLFIAKLLKNIFSKVTHRLITHKNLANMAVSFIHLILIAIIVFAALSILGLDKTVTTLLAGAGVIGLALAFAFQDIAANFVSGVFIAVRRPFKAGDIIKTKDLMGIVDIVNLRDTILKTFQGQVIVVPNKDIFQNPIINFSRSGERRLDIECGISYSDDLERVKQLTIEALSSLPQKTNEKPVGFIFEKFDSSSINYIATVWLNSVEQSVYLEARSNAIQLIKTAYDKNDISIPFPIRTLDFGANTDLKAFANSNFINK